MQRAWCGWLFCAALGAQDARPAPDADALLAKITEARARLQAAQVSATALQVGRSGDVLLDANPTTARSQAVNLYQRPPDPRQALASFAERVALLDDGEATTEPVAGARARAVVLQRARTMPQMEHLQGIKTLTDLREALVTSDDQRKATLALMCAAISPGEPSTVAALLRCLDSKNAELRWRAALGIGWSRGSAAAREAVPALAERLNDPDLVVRAFAAGALARIAPDAKELGAAVAALESGADVIGHQIASIIRSEQAQRLRSRPGVQPQRGGRGQASAPPAPARSAPASRPTTQKKRVIG